MSVSPVVIQQARLHGSYLLARNDLPSTPRHIVEKAMARHALKRARLALLGRGDLPFWKALNYGEALLRSAIRGHVSRRPSR